MTSEKTVTMREEQMLALLGLAASQSKSTEACPPPEQLAAFIDGHLSSTQRREMLAHLNRCEQCYQEWLKTALAVAELEPKPAPTQAQKWWQKLAKTWRAPWTLPLAAAVAASFAIAIVVIQKPSEQAWPAPELAAVVQNYPDLKQAERAFPEIAPLAFAFSQTPQDPAKQALAAGVQAARHWLGGSNMPQEDQWLRSPWRDYYDLGQWAFLTWALAQAEGVLPREWQVFERYCQNLILRFERHTGEPAAYKIRVWLQETHVLLNSLANHPDPAQAARLARRIQTTLPQFLT